MKINTQIRVPVPLLNDFTSAIKSQTISSAIEKVMGRVLAGDLALENNNQMGKKITSIMVEQDTLIRFKAHVKALGIPFDEAIRQLLKAVIQEKAQ